MKEEGVCVAAQRADAGLPLVAVVLVQGERKVGCDLTQPVAVSCQEAVERASSTLPLSSMAEAATL